MCARLPYVGLIAAGSWLLVMTGCGPKASGPMIQIGTTKASLLGPPLEYRALAPRLETLFESQVVFRAQPDGAAIGTQLGLEEIQFAILTARQYCEIEDPSGLKLLATAINATGKTSRKVHIVAREGSGISSVFDLKGKRFAFGTHGDLLTDFAAQAALKKAGLPLEDLATEILPPPIAFDGRLYAGKESANKVALPILRGDFIPISAGIIDEVAYAALRDTGGNIITGPAKDDFRIIGETMAVPELLVVAGPAASAEDTAALTDFLLNHASGDKNICKQMGIKGFAQPDKESYDLVRLLISRAN